MLSRIDPISALERSLADAVSALGLEAHKFGLPDVVQKASEEAETLFQGIAKAKPSKEDSYRAALSFARGKALSLDEAYLAASALCVPLREQSGACAVGTPRIDILLAEYETEAKNGTLWRLTWYGLLTSYLSFDAGSGSASDRSGWEKLRTTLQATWPFIEKECRGKAVPDWVRVVREEDGLLTETPVQTYASEYLDGKEERVNRLATDLGIPESSWFWHALVLAAVEQCCSRSDSEFKAKIPRLIQLIQARPVFRDEAIETILIRYNKCSNTEVHKQLCDFVVDKDVWRNPKLKDVGIATAWNRVPEKVWRMVRSWVNEANLRLFFELLAGRSGSDEGRLHFWSRYLDQIQWTRLVFGHETIQLSRRNPQVRALLAQEYGSYATFQGSKDLDAFLMQIGNYVIVEFSKTGNACYVYPSQDLVFDPDAKQYAGDTSDLKYGYYRGAAAKVVHRDGWEDGAERELRSLGILPDRAKPRRVRTVAEADSGAIHKGSDRAGIAVDSSPNPALFNMRELEMLVARYPRATVLDSRRSTGGRLWVEDPRQDLALANALQKLGFKWSNKRSAWYYPGRE